jgi:xanthine dehydrogenase accessory factor
MGDGTHDLGAVLDRAAAWLADGRRAAFATVTKTWGSSPRPVGSKLACNDAGEFVGSVSGGCIEAAVITEAIDLMSGDREPGVLSFGVTDETAWNAGLACGGKIDVEIEIATAERIAQLRAEMPPPPRLIIIGAVHVAAPLAQMARIAGFAITIVDPRRAWGTPERFPNDTLVTEWPDVALDALAIDASTAIVALTHDPKIDDPGLIAALKSPAFYIGCLGSKKTHAARRERLGVQFDEATLDRLHGPVGLDIGAKTPAEIAVSILAEVIATLRGRDPRATAAAS